MAAPLGVEDWLSCMVHLPSLHLTNQQLDISPPMPQVRTISPALGMEETTAVVQCCGCTPRLMRMAADAINKGRLTVQVRNTQTDFVSDIYDSMYQVCMLLFLS